MRCPECECEANRPNTIPLSSRVMILSSVPGILVGRDAASQDQFTPSSLRGKLSGNWKEVISTAALTSYNKNVHALSSASKRHDFDG